MVEKLRASFLFSILETHFLPFCLSSVNPLESVNSPAVALRNTSSSQPTPLIDQRAASKASIISNTSVLHSDEELLIPKTPESRHKEATSEEVLEDTTEAPSEAPTSEAVVERADQSEHTPKKQDKSTGSSVPSGIERVLILKHKPPKNS